MVSLPLAHTQPPSQLREGPARLLSRFRKRALNVGRAGRVRVIHGKTVAHDERGGLERPFRVISESGIR